MFRTITTLAAIAPLLALPAHAIAAEPAKAGFSLGGGLAVVPEYAGASRLRALPLIVAEYQSGTGFFSGSRGIGYETSVDGVGVSAAFTYDAGRKDRQKAGALGSDDLKGMGDIKGAAVGVFGTSYDAGFAKLSLDAHLAASNRARGNTYVVGLSRPLFVSAEHQVALTASATYADAKSVQTYFGVTAAQATASGYRAYRPGAGFESITMALNWNLVLDAHWSVRSAAGLSRLVGDAGASPIVRRRSQALLGTTLNYAF